MAGVTISIVRVTAVGVGRRLGNDGRSRSGRDGEDVIRRGLVPEGCCWLFWPIDIVHDGSR